MAEIKIKILPDGKVEIDSECFGDCEEIANHFAKLLGKVETFVEKENFDSRVEIKVRPEHLLNK